MTPPERLQDVTLAERLRAFIAQRERMQHPGIVTEANGVPLTLNDLREAAAALSVRGDVEEVVREWAEWVDQDAEPYEDTYMRWFLRLRAAVATPPSEG